MSSIDPNLRMIRTVPSKSHLTSQLKAEQFSSTKPYEWARSATQSHLAPITKPQSRAALSNDTMGPTYTH